VKHGRGILAIVPVKPLSRAKSRLAHAFDERQRRDLAAAMLTDVLRAIAAVHDLAGIALATSDADAAKIGTAFAARRLEDAHADLNAALADAARIASDEGRAGILILPADVPAVTPDDLRALIEGHPPGPAISIVPSHDGEGTNALLCCPPRLVAPAFGARSFAAHRDAARRAGATCRRVDVTRIAQDVDHPCDLEAALRLGAGPSTTALVSRWRDSEAPA
jgi:2-phospho-L-lactate guanylyltransferase